MGQKAKNLLPIRTFHSKTIKKHFHGRMPIPSCGTKYIFRSFLQSSAFLCITHKRLPAIPFAPGCTARKKPPFLDASMSEMSPREVDFCAQLCQAYLLVKSVTAFCRIATVANRSPSPCSFMPQNERRPLNLSFKAVWGDFPHSAPKSPFSG